VHISISCCKNKWFLEQQTNIKFCVKSECKWHFCNGLQSLLGEAMKSQVFSEWHKQFKVGHKNVEDDELSGHPRSHRVKKM